LISKILFDCVALPKTGLRVSQREMPKALAGLGIPSYYIQRFIIPHQWAQTYPLFCLTKMNFLLYLKDVNNFIIFKYEGEYISPSQTEGRIV
jgi:hypothetical protein